MNKIYFWRTSDPYGCLSNFSRHPIVWQEKIWPTSEALYQAFKFNNVEIREKIRLADNPKLCKIITYKHIRENPEMLVPEWDKIKLEIMRAVLRLKYDQHEIVRNKLSESGDSELIEASPWDSFWGYGSDQKGQNWLGKLWMELRRQKGWWCHNCKDIHTLNCPFNNGGRE